MKIIFSIAKAVVRVGAKAFGVMCLNEAGGGAARVGAGAAAELGDAAIEAIEHAYDDWARGRSELDKHKDLQELAAADRQTLLEAARQAARQEAPGVVDEALFAELAVRFQAGLRQSLRRPSDPTGMSVPSSFALKKPDFVAMMPARLSRLRAGQLISEGRRELLELLGVGGFGEVWRTRNPDRTMAPHTAVKFCTDPAAARALRNEMELLDRLMAQRDLPAGVVRMLDVSLRSDPPFVEYELLEGGDLAGLCREMHAEGQASPEWATEMLRKIAEVVAYFHRLRPPMVHRDLKPSNILLTPRSLGPVYPKIADFGIGGIGAEQAIELEKRQTSRSRQALLTTALLGSHSPMYASPQQKFGAAPDPRDDVYALGVIWQQLLTGDLTVATPPGKTGKARLRERGFSEAHLELLLECLGPEREDRPADAGELLARLGGTAEGSRTDEAARQAEQKRMAAELEAKRQAEQKRMAEEKPKRPQTLNVPRDYATIQAALDAARPGETVLVEPGTYPETLRLPEGVTLRGQNRDRCRIVAVDGKDCALLAENIRGGTVENLTFDGKHAFIATNHRVAGLKVVDAVITVHNCVVVNWDGDGLWVTGAKSAPTLKGNVARANKEHGLAFEQGACGTAKGNTAEANEDAGISCFNPGTAPTLKGNMARANKQFGLAFIEGACGTAEGNTAEANEWCGISCFNPGTAPTLKGNVARGNKKHGLAFEQGACGTAEGNTAEANEWCGISCFNPGTAPTLKGNVARGNKKHGLAFEHGACGTAEGNTAEANVDAGISCFNPGTAPTLKGNVARANKMHGLAFEQGACGTAEGNTAEANEEDGICCHGMGTAPTLIDNLVRGNKSGFGIAVRNGARWHGYGNRAEGGDRIVSE